MKYIVSIINNKNISIYKIGGKAHSLIKLLSLKSKKVKISPGCIITTDLYDYYRKYKKFPDEFKIALQEVLEKLKIKDKEKIVRSSATIEDSISHSFAGQFKSISRVKSLEETLKAIEEVFKSVNTQRVRKYLEFSETKIPVKMAVIIQEFINTDYGGVIFSENPLNKDEILIEISKGLTENVVDSKVEAKRIILNRKNLSIKNTELNLSERIIRKLGNLAIEIENLFGSPVDIEFGIKNGTIYLFQSRYITPKKIKINKIKIPSGFNVLEGIPLSTGIAVGKARIIRNKEDLKKLKNNEILIAKATYNDYMPEMLKARGIVTEEGNITSHSAIVAREFGIPAVIGVKDILKVVKDGVEMIVDSMNGKVYYKGKKLKRKELPEWIDDLVLDVVAYNLEFKQADEVEIIKNPQKVFFVESYRGKNVLYFYPKTNKEFREKAIKFFNGIDGGSDKHHWFVEWTYGFLIHKGLKEVVEEGKKALNDPKELDIFLSGVMKICRKKLRDAFKLYQRAKNERDIEKLHNVLILVDLSSCYFEIANSLFPLGYGMRKLREIATKCGKEREILANIENYKDISDLYQLYKVLVKWKFASDNADVWEERKILWENTRKRIKEFFGFDIEDFFEYGSAYKLDIYLYKKFGIKPKYF